MVLVDPTGREEETYSRETAGRGGTYRGHQSHHRVIGHVERSSNITFQVFMVQTL
jgi:mRNA-degrading endonuclease RelE of RelBE toxin-antitoxin system